MVCVCVHVYVQVCACVCDINKFGETSSSSLMNQQSHFACSTLLECFTLVFLLLQDKVQPAASVSAVNAATQNSEVLAKVTSPSIQQHQQTGNCAVSLQNQTGSSGSQTLIFGNQTIAIGNQEVTVSGQQVSVGNQVTTSDNQIVNIVNQPLSIGNHVIANGNQVVSIGNQLVAIGNQHIQPVLIDNQAVVIGSPGVVIGNQLAYNEGQDSLMADYLPQTVNTAVSEMNASVDQTNTSVSAIQCTLPLVDSLMEKPVIVRQESTNIPHPAQEYLTEEVGQSVEAETFIATPISQPYAEMATSNVFSQISETDSTSVIPDMQFPTHQYIEQQHGGLQTVNSASQLMVAADQMLNMTSDGQVVSAVLTNSEVNNLTSIISDAISANGSEQVDTSEICDTGNLEQMNQIQTDSHVVVDDGVSVPGTAGSEVLVGSVGHVGETVSADTGVITNSEIPVQETVVETMVDRRGQGREDTGALSEHGEADVEGMGVGPMDTS